MPAVAVYYIRVVEFYEVEERDSRARFGVMAHAPMNQLAMNQRARGSQNNVGNSPRQ